MGTPTEHEEFFDTEIHFDGFDDSEVDWRKNNEDVEGEDDDEPLAETPPDVVFMLGFDPLEEEEEE